MAYCILRHISHNTLSYGILLSTSHYSQYRKVTVYFTLRHIDHYTETSIAYVQYVTLFTVHSQLWHNAQYVSLLTMCGRLRYISHYLTLITIHQQLRHIAHWITLIKMHFHFAQYDTLLTIYWKLRRMACYVILFTLSHCSLQHTARAHLPASHYSRRQTSRAHCTLRHIFRLVTLLSTTHWQEHNSVRYNTPTATTSFSLRHITYDVTLPAKTHWQYITLLATSHWSLPNIDLWFGDRRDDVTDALSDRWWRRINCV